MHIMEYYSAIKNKLLIHTASMDSQSVLKEALNKGIPAACLYLYRIWKQADSLLGEGGKNRDLPLAGEGGSHLEKGTKKLSEMMEVCYILRQGCWSHNACFCQNTLQSVCFSTCQLYNSNANSKDNNSPDPGDFVKPPFNPETVHLWIFLIEDGKKLQSAYFGIFHYF